MKGDLRNENICLNCGAEVSGRFCSECGQENREPRESFGELLYHFFSDFTHFDSKFFTTIKDLVIHPGFLTTQYLEGKRMRYLHPIRMYIFISFLFFIFLGLLNNNTFINNENSYGNAAKTAQAIQALQQKVNKLKASGNPYDSSAINKLQSQMNVLKLSGEKNMTFSEYDSLQQTLPKGEKVSGIGGFFLNRFAKGKALYGPQYFQMMVERFMHDIPKAMFFLLPLFALFLKWFYRKGHFYSDHAIFSLHFHSLAFLLMLVTFLLDTMFRVHFFESYTVLILFIYLGLALKNVYKRSLVGSFFKAVWISILYSISILIVLSIVGVIVFAAM
ncbi:MAG: DUF3667 domain-containing protein [Chitinophagaceae bacterium]|nr:MAG: DUF3667 domain-containing protein [Chitinophagaceae bacterium]